MSFDQVAVDARRALLDALEVLAPHRDALVLIGAQAVYLHTGDADVAIATTTKDSDIALIPDRLGEDPLIDQMMRAGRFTHDLEGHQGVWLSPDGIPVELLVPQSLQPGTGRGARIAPHGKRVARNVPGIEAAAVDFVEMIVIALDPDDLRSETVNVAGPAALLIAKTHKIHDRMRDAAAGKRDRRSNKDAHDVYRLLLATPLEAVVSALGRLKSNPVSASVTTEALEALAFLNAAPDAILARMAAATVEFAAGSPAEAEQIGAATQYLVQDVLDAVS